MIVVVVELSEFGTAGEVGTPPTPDETVITNVELPRTKKVVVGRSGSVGFVALLDGGASLDAAPVPRT